MRILPDKHISIEQSTIGVGSLLLTYLNRPKTVSGFWESVREKAEIGTFERFTLTLDFLYAIGAIEFKEGLLRRCHK